MAGRWQSSRWVAIAVASLLLAGYPRAEEPRKAEAIPDACPANGCLVESGKYRIILPARASKEHRSGAIMYFHGWQGSAEETISDRSLAAAAERLGVALIAPDGMGRTWSYPGSPGHYRDEFAFVAQVLDDVERRFPIDASKIMASGFSQGGSMVWYLACRMPSRFAGFAPIAGSFWEPLPQQCAGPRPNLIHIHGTADTTIPLAGRWIGSRYKQGDLFRSFAVFAPGDCTASWATAARDVASRDEMVCRQATTCSGTARLELCLHPGGHFADPAWIERAWHLAIPRQSPAPAVGARLTLP